MKIQKIAIATVVGAIFLVLIDMVWYTMIMKESMDMPNARLDAAGQPAPDMLWMIISYVIFAFAFATIYSNWSGGSSKVNAGLNFGIWAGLIIGLSMNLMWYSITTLMTLNQALVDSVYTIVKCALLGIIVAFATGLPGGDRGKAQGAGE